MQLIPPPAAIISGEKKILTAAASSVVLSNIPAGKYIELRLIGDISAISLGSWFNVGIVVNNVLTGYEWNLLHGYAGTVTQYISSSNAFALIGKPAIPAGLTGKFFGKVSLCVDNSDLSIEAKGYLTSGAGTKTVISGASGRVGIGSTISSIEIKTLDTSAKFQTGFEFDLYGVN